MSIPNINAPSRAKTILSTTLVLTATTLLARTIVVYYNVYLSGKIGALGVGIFELIMSVYVFAKTASTAGVSLAATRMAAEHETSFARTMRRLIFCCLLLGAVCALILYVLSPFLCDRVLNSPPGGVLALRILAFSLPFLSMASAYGGFFMARRKMRSYAPIQITEQLIRVGLTVALLEHFSKHSLSFSICSIALAITLSEIVAFLFSALFYLFLSRREKIKSDKEPFRVFLRAFSRLAAPVGGGALFRASLNTVYNILVPVGLRKSGQSSDRSLAAYGTVQGMALPILLYPSAVMGVLSMQLVPEIAQLRAQDKKREIAYITGRIMRFALLFSITCAGILFFFSAELSDLIFRTDDAAPFIRALAPLIPVMYLDTVTDGILKGLDLQLKVLAIGIVDSLVSLLCIYVLLPPFAITGYIVTIYAGECINTLLGHFQLRKHVDVRMGVVRSVLLPICCVGLGCMTAKGLILAHQVAFSGPLTILAVLFSLIVCVVLWLILGAITKEETHWICNLLFLRKDADALSGFRKIK